MCQEWGDLSKRKESNPTPSFLPRHIPLAMLQNTIKILRLGLTPYSKALKLQEHLVNKTKTKIAGGELGENILILLQHHPVYTTGIRTKVT